MAEGWREMKKLISFRQLKFMCCFNDEEGRGFNGCRVKCNSKNCPVWKKLQPKQESKQKTYVTLDGRLHEVLR